MARKKRGSGRGEADRFVRVSITMPRELAARVNEHVERPSGVSGALRKLALRGLDALAAEKVTS